MTHTTIVTAQGIAGDQRYVEALVDISSYTAGGEVISELTGMFAQVDSVFVQVMGSTGYFVNVPTTKDKIIVRTATATVASTAADVGKFGVRIHGR